MEKQEIKETEICSHIALNHPSGSCIEITKFNGLEKEDYYDDFEVGGNIQINSIAAIKMYSADEMQIVSEESITHICKNTIFSTATEIKQQATKAFFIETGRDIKKTSLVMAETDIYLETPSNSSKMYGVGDGDFDASRIEIMNFGSGGSIKIVAEDHSIEIYLGGNKIRMSEAEGIIIEGGNIKIGCEGCNVELKGTVKINGIEQNAD